MGVTGGGTYTHDACAQKNVGNQACVNGKAFIFGKPAGAWAEISTQAGISIPASLITDVAIAEGCVAASKRDWPPAEIDIGDDKGDGRASIAAKSAIGVT